MRGRLDRDTDTREIGVDLRAGVIRDVDELHAHAQLLRTRRRHDLAADLHGARVARQRERQVHDRAQGEGDGGVQAQPAPRQVAGATEVALRTGRLFDPHLDRDARTLAPVPFGHGADGAAVTPTRTGVYGHATSSVGSPWYQLLPKSD